jgi:hypothetical protein
MHIKPTTTAIVALSLSLIVESTVIFSSVAHSTELFLNNTGFVGAKPVFVLFDSWLNKQAPSRNDTNDGKKIEKKLENNNSSSGQPYSRCYMNCINASHPGDYCQDHASNFCD